MRPQYHLTYRVYGAPQPLQAAPFFPCQTRFVPQRRQTSNLFTLAPQFWHEYFRLPPLAVFSMGVPHSGHTFWSCLMASSPMSEIAMNAHLPIFAYQILLNSTTRQSPPHSPPGCRTATQLPSYPVFE